MLGEIKHTKIVMAIRFIIICKKELNESGLNSDQLDNLAEALFSAELFFKIAMKQILKKSSLNLL